jgi:hypothetical protein
VAIFDWQDIRKAAVTTAGTVPNYTVTLYDGPSSYYDGLTFVIRPHSNQNETTPTLNVNGLGAKNLVFNTVSQLYATLRPYMLGTAGAYRVTFDASIDSFVVHNPTFGQEINFTPTFGVVGGGPVTLLSNADTNYRWISNKTIMVRTYVSLSLSSATSGLQLALPYKADGDDRLVVGSGYITNLTGLTQYSVLVLIYTDLINMRIVNNNIGATFSADTGFQLQANIIYNVDVLTL